MGLIRKFGQGWRLFELTSNRMDQRSAREDYLVVRLNHAHPPAQPPPPARPPAPRPTPTASGAKLRPTQLIPPVAAAARAAHAQPIGVAALISQGGRVS